ncbi:TIGR03086 family metal-binding protein [Micromonospora sp. WMMD980]|uniref:TIGR03086 family metal-binding protein n=1 Tax=Micromonospora sp. WMMD980 TaxID=3016088 RepID=UPI002415DBC8|nr:TIGR03086 family metal-binding protein [Micromonospora sp. WMMD980]MDG4803537.1 TIGR03086 family metal-binding protein [Micromonospora sp. WMMD980]
MRISATSAMASVPTGSGAGLQPVSGASDRPTPCPEYPVRDLLNHLFEVAVNFQAMARREEVDWSGGVDHLTDGWRDRFATETQRLVEAWSDPDALEGVSPGMGLPQETVGLMALIDLTVHGWDLARATGATARGSR